MVDLVVVAIISLATWHGWRRGTLLMGLSVLSIGAGYIGALLLYKPVGHAMARGFHIPPLLALPIAGLLVMFTISTVVKVAMWKVERRRAVQRREGLEPNPADSAGGAAIGALRAAALVVIGAWALLTIQNLAHAGPDLSRSMTGRASAAIMQRATFAVARRATGDPLMANVMSMMAARPEEGVRTMNAVIRDVRVQQLWTDTLLRSSLAHGDEATLAGSATVRSLASDTAFLAAVQKIGVTPGGAGTEELAAQLVRQVGPLVRSVESVQSDPEIRRMMDSPELRGMMQRGDFAALVANPQFNQLAGRILARLRSGGNAL
jgi:uncharacterized membrane protein required for colicin V production